MSRVRGYRRISTCPAAPLCHHCDVTCCVCLNVHHENPVHVASRVFFHVFQLMLGSKLSCPPFGLSTINCLPLTVEFANCLYWCSSVSFESGNDAVSHRCHFVKARVVPHCVLSFCGTLVPRLVNGLDRYSPWLVFALLTQRPQRFVF